MDTYILQPVGLGQCEDSLARQQARGWLWNLQLQEKSHPFPSLWHLLLGTQRKYLPSSDWEP